MGEFAYNYVEIGGEIGRGVVLGRLRHEAQWKPVRIGQDEVGG
jgi:hypothetical protein